MFPLSLPKASGVLISLCIIAWQINSGSASSWKASDTELNKVVVDEWHQFNSDVLGESFVNSALGFISTRDGDILKTRDGGKTWIVIYSRATPLRGVHAVDEKQVWVVGADGTILHTKDGGESWVQQKSGTPSTLFAVQFWDRETGWAAGDAGAVLITSTGGERWEAISAPGSKRIQAISFISKTVGWAVGADGMVLRTTDGGYNWNRVPVGEDEELFSISFGSDGQGVIGGKFGRLLYTTTKGDIWTKITLNREVDLHAVYIDQGGRGWAAGSGGFLHRFEITRDGSLNWRAVASGTFADLRLLCFKDGRGWAVGKEGTVVGTEGDERWVLLRGRQVAPSRMRDITWRSAREGWIASSGGVALRTVDRGQTWVTVPFPWPATTSSDHRTLAAIRFFGETRGFAVGDGGAIFRSDDGGDTWALQESPTNFDLLGLSVVHEDKAWAVGIGGTVIYTEDGTNWVRKSVGEQIALTGVHFLDENHGWIVGHGGVILNTINGRDWQTQHHQVNLRLQSIYLQDREHGWAVGAIGGQGSILKTHDGTKWEHVRMPRGRGQFNGITFTSPTTGWIVGYQGRLIKTTDGGKHWQQVNLPTEAALFSVAGVGHELAGIVGTGVIFQLVPHMFSPLIEFDAVSEGSAVEIVGKLDHSSHQVDIGRLEYSVGETRRYRPLGLDGSIPVVSDTFRYKWHPGTEGFRSGTPFRYRITVTDGPSEYVKEVNASFVYKSWLYKLIDDHRLLIYLITLYCLWAMLLASWPRLLFAVYPAWRSLSQTLGDSYFGKICSPILGAIFIIPYLFKLPWIVRRWADRYASGKGLLYDLEPTIRADYIERSPILQAWVAREYGRAKDHQLRVLAQQSEHGIYIQLPVTLNGAEIDRPTPEQFKWISSADSALLCVLGAGGTGKSTLAAKLGLWALDGFDEDGVKNGMVPIFIKKPTDDLGIAVKEVIKIIVGDDDRDLDDLLVAALLRHRAVLVIIDSLSEWPRTQQQYIQDVHGKIRIGAMVITSRISLDHGRAVSTAFVGALTNKSILRFSTDYLDAANQQLNRDMKESLDTGLVNMLYRWFQVEEATCLLVRLYIDDFTSQLGSPGPVQPESAPDVILRYVEKLINPNNSDRIMTVVSDRVMTIVKAIAESVVGRTYAPRSVLKQDLTTTLLGEFKNEPIDDILAHLINGGILRQVDVAGASHIEFAFDPIAEFPASIRICERAIDFGKDDWEQFCNKLTKIPGYPVAIEGFLDALWVSLSTYRDKMQLPTYIQPPDRYCSHPGSSQ